ncbi:cysteine--tRNA ligase [Buchnera aphidicola (Rhopalosiphum padi)]|uniref:Cysteine--tRNA ligase n=1 Tax=Buchnera aphidicola subsp. Rhopalosiphum padi TaxID=98793 RepID=A0A4D6YHK9_BUCRP|nr:cysteine--tRNA ligase [Buchnera aphidicola]QCI25108.1 cysteine--tRNA ligase [Buchnera aphidicola (Rhopalosiphum padi)]
MLKIFNTATSKKEIFKPIKNKKINLYVCGVTVYDFCHIGHARTFVVFDMIVRYLRLVGFQVKYVRNITDIDDKIILKSLKEKIDINTFTNTMIKEMNKDFSLLGISPPDVEPRVTTHISDIITVIKKLIKSKNAYISDQGDVVFSINSDKLYGTLSGQFLDRLISGTRIAINKTKKNSLDFILWKKYKKEEKFFWDSPWGKGRPGWHIECTAITNVFFKDYIDIHGGGADLLFPHHENEISQSRCLNKKFRVKLWMHSGLVIIKNQKMSKSLGNSFFLKDILIKYEAEVLRFFFLSTHYRHPIYYTEENLKKSQISLKYLYMTLYGTKPVFDPVEGLNFEMDFYKALNDDFNTPQAFSVLFKLARKINYLKKIDLSKSNFFAFRLQKLAGCLGFLLNTSRFFLQKTPFLDKKTIEKIEFLIEKRNFARKSKLWKEADKLRDELTKLNVFLEDFPEKTLWYFKK